MPKLFVPVLFAAVLVSQSSPASNYPGDYTMKSSCRSNGPVQVCRGYQVGTGLASLDIRYGGDLAGSQGLQVWMQMNDRDSRPQGLFPVLNSSANLSYFRITGGCLVGRTGGCLQGGTAEMRDLLAWAQRSDGTLNAMDFEIAFVDSRGRWDNGSGAGRNYRFSFPQE